ncbi:hypothetical protein Y032_0009g757 [Ancylostoma ceylanicum]|uniref:Reverse transcriptase domain-containing protein n=2 Tax=Ancylostoma ceylanicum TaxID=53326 RepID=A0A016VIQ4_9BILA|nr:hypothetical protein Y032_0009g757 [Ancylostoma ceylanicum]
MPRFKDSRTWEVIREVPAQHFRLVKEVLSMRQKIVTIRQNIHFLRRCIQHRVIPHFVRSRKLHELCGHAEGSPKMLEIETKILRISLRNKQDQLFSLLKKCATKEKNCARYLEARLWKRIVGESMSICGCIRANVKSVLQKKFEALLCKSHGNLLRQTDATSSSSQSDGRTEPDQQSVPEASRVTVIGGYTLSPQALAVLELGPSFSPSQPISDSLFRKVVGNLQALQDRLRYKAKLDRIGISTLQQSNTIPAPPFPRMFHSRQEPNDDVDSRFRLFATDLFHTLSRFNRVTHRSNLTNSQKCGIREIRELIATQSIRLSISDKGGDFVVIPRALDRAITEQHLSDATLYRLSSAQEFIAQSRKLNKIWVRIAKAANLRPIFISRLKVEMPVCPVLYLLIKTHKLSADDLVSTDPSVYKVRPIISGVGGPSDRISWFLNLILVQLLQFVPAHLKNTTMFLDHLRNSQFDNSCVMESFDVNALYTNVSNDSAMQAVLELLTEHHKNINLHGFSISQVMELLNECLNCTIFRWSGEYFAQTRGLAMGQRLAPVLAIAFMAKIETPILESRPLLYCRYIDDCFIVCSTQTEMDRLFELMNEQSEHIKLTREKPKQDWLPFLNVQNSSKGVFRKRRERGITRFGAYSNGYPPRERRGWQRCTQMRKRNANTDNKVQFCMPFISDEVSRATRLCLRRANLESLVTLVELPPSNLKRQLIRNRIYDRLCTTSDCVVCPFGREGDCMRSCVIYVIKCRECGDEYVGETARPLCVRVKEHLEGKSSSRLSTPLGRHRAQAHNGVDFEVQVTILAGESEISARKTLEAFWIHSKNPKMNRREECPTITSELLPYLAACNI